MFQKLYDDLLEYFKKKRKERVEKEKEKKRDKNRGCIEEASGSNCGLAFV